VPGELRTAVEAGFARVKKHQAPRSDHVAALKSRAAEAKTWLFEAALPLWWDIGFDHAAQCFHEKLDSQGRPVPSPRRVRVQARQTFVYAAAGKLGWSGPWREATSAGAAVLLERGLRTDGG